MRPNCGFEFGGQQVGDGQSTHYSTLGIYVGCPRFYKSPPSFENLFSFPPSEQQEQQQPISRYNRQRYLATPLVVEKAS
jgi:hypothetical protein